MYNKSGHLTEFHFKMIESEEVQWAAHQLLSLSGKPTIPTGPLRRPKIWVNTNHVCLEHKSGFLTGPWVKVSYDTERGTYYDSLGYTYDTNRFEFREELAIEKKLNNMMKDLCFWP